jgi:hypothetical protein
VLLTFASLPTLAGRSLAMCAHPYAAWRVQSKRVRALVVVAYAAAGYAVVLGVLMSL